MAGLASRGAVDAPDSSASAVPFFSQVVSFAEIWPELARHIDEIFDDNRYSNGLKVGELEAAVRAYTGARHAIGVSNGTDALVVLLRACGVGPGDEVVVPAFTFAASATTVALVGARPVFADIEPETYGLDPAAAGAAVTDRTKAIMPVHLFCQMADMTALSGLARSRALTVVEDSAEAIGMRWDGTHAGLLGAGGVLSFFPTKTLGAFGDAGMVITNDDDVARAARALRNHGRRPPGPDPAPGVADLTRDAGLAPDVAALAGVAQLATLPGGNAKMDDLQAAVLLPKLARLDRDVARRAELAAAYTERLTGLAGVRRLPTVVDRSVSTTPVFYVYLVEVDNRDGLVEHLAAHRIGTEVYYPRPLHLQPCFAELGYRPGDFPHAETACAHTLGLPFYPDLTDSDVDRVCRAIRDFYAAGGHG